MNEISQGWFYEPLSCFVKEMGDGGTPSRAAEENFGGTIPWVVITDFQRQIEDTAEHLTDIGLSRCTAKLWPKESVILSTGATIGKVGIAKVPLATKQGITGLVPNDRITSRFLYYKLLSKKQKLNAWAQGSTFAEIRTSILGKVPFEVPHNKLVQKKLADILECTDQAIEKTEALIEKYQQIKAGLMHDLFTRGIGPDGKLRPPREKAPELYQETPIGWIPMEWKIVSAISICHPVTKGTTPHAFEPAESVNTIPYLRVENLSFDGSLGFEGDQLFVNQKTHETDLSRSKVYPGDILMNIVGPPLGKVSMVPATYLEWNTNQAIAIFRTRQVEYRNYLLFYLLSEFSGRWFFTRAKQTSGQVNLTLEMCNNLEIPLPENADEILAISERMNGVFEKLRRSKAELEKLVEVKAGLMHDLLTGKVQVNPNPPEATHV